MKIKTILYRGKRYIVLINSKNEILDKKRYSKHFRKKDAIIQFKKTNSLYENKKLFKLSNYAEIEETETENYKLKPDYMYQAFVKIKVNKTIITARSRKHEKNYPIQKAYNEAEKSAFELLSEYYGHDYDADIGEQIFSDNKNSMIERGIVYYKNL